MYNTPGRPRTAWFPPSSSKGTLVGSYVVVEGKPLRVLAATAYPPAVASARVRLVAHGSLLTAHGVDLDYQPALSDDEYRLVASRAPVARKVAILLASS